MGWVMVAGLCSGLAVLSWWPSTARLRPERSEPRSWVALSDAQRRRVATAIVVAAAVTFAVSSLGWVALPIGAAAAVGSYLLLGRMVSAGEAQRRARLTAALPAMCDLIAVCLQAGLPVRRAAAVVGEAMDGPISDELAEVAAKVALGVDEQRAWSEFAYSPPLAKVGRELARGAASGVALTQRLAGLGTDARRAAAASAETAAKRVGVRSVLPLMVCFLPAFVLLGLVPIIGGMVSRLFG